MTLMMGPDPSELQGKKKKSLILMGIAPGALLGVIGSLVESSMKQPFKLAFELCTMVQTMLPEHFGKAFSMVWFGISNLKVFYILMGLLYLIVWTSVSLFSVGVVLGAFIGGAVYWFLSIAQP